MLGHGSRGHSSLTGAGAIILCLLAEPPGIGESWAVPAGAVPAGAGQIGTDPSPAEALLLSADAVEGFPQPSGSEEVSSTIKVTGIFDGGMKRSYGLGDGGTGGGQPPIFRVENGGTVKNVVLGAPAGAGIHCYGSCHLQNVWWADVGEDAAPLKASGNSNPTMVIDGGGARSAADTVFQHNGPGTMIIRNFTAQGIGKLYRSCGNCKPQFQRTVRLENVTVSDVRSAVIGVNGNYGDSANISGLKIKDGGSVPVRLIYRGNETGDEPVVEQKSSSPSGC